MHGLINCAIEMFVRDTYGRKAWIALALRCDLGMTEVEAMLSYDDEITLAMLGELARAQDKPVDTLLEDIGTYLVSHPTAERVRRLLRFSGDTFTEFLRSLDDLPARARLAVPDIGFPRLELREHNLQHFSLQVRHGGKIPPVFGHVLVGVLRAMADDYGALVLLEHKGGSAGTEIISINLLETDFAQGRSFVLAEVPGMTAQTADLSGMLDTLCPMHVVLDPTGHVRHAGPTLSKVLGIPMQGQRFFELFELMRPRLTPSMAALREASGQRLHLRLREGARIELKGVLVPLPTGPDGALVVNLSFGLSVVEAVSHFDLTNADFAATDLTVEMLYLVEAKSAAMEASRKLNLRLQGAKVQAEEQAYTDTLTGLNNRRALEPVITRLIEAGEDFALMHLDLDHFKAVNDTMGHAAGDHVLEVAARILREETRTGDTIIRVGGDEFLLIFAPLIRAGNLADIAARLIRRLQQPIVFRDQICRISASLGSTLSQDYDAPAMQTMMDDADCALYAAKEAGRGQHVAFTPALRDAQASEIQPDMAQKRQQA